LEPYTGARNFSDRGSFRQAELAAFHFVRSRCLLLVKAVACWRGSYRN
jgi:hypothetical protein